MEFGNLGVWDIPNTQIPKFHFLTIAESKKTTCYSRLQNSILKKDINRYR